MSLVATDRYRLSVRTMTARAAEGPGRSALVDAGQLAALTAWCSRRDAVTVTASGACTALEGGGEQRVLTVVEAEYPDYRAVLDGLVPATSRVVVSRTGLLDALLGGAAPGPVTLLAGDDRLVVRGPDGAVGVLDAVCTGEDMRVGFAPPVLAAALAAGVGPDVVLEVSAPDRAAVVRSADQGTFTTLVMPTLLDAVGRDAAR